MSRLRFQIVDREHIPPLGRDTMFALMQRCYEDVERARFEHDLARKRYVIELRERGNGVLRGFFSTVHLSLEQTASGPCEVLFSGDTVIHPAFWGDKSLHLGFIRLAAARRLRHPQRPLYWLLLSKGYKTYLLMANHFPLSTPRLDTRMPDEGLALRERLAVAWWPDAYDTAAGVVRHAGLRDRVRHNLAPAEAAARDAHVRHFLACNPQHAQGDELVCLARIRLRDLARGLGYVATRRWLRARHAPTGLPAPAGR